jgi:redox-sensing transcriptional repressor
MGIKAIWNFSPTRLIVPQDVLVRDEHISLGFAEISHHLAQLSEEAKVSES